MKDEIKETLKERGKTHGDYKENALLAKALKDYLRVSYQTAKGDADVSNLLENNAMIRYTLDAIAVKLARISTGNALEPDHWKDIAGYAYLMYMQLVGENLND